MNILGYSLNTNYPSLALDLKTIINTINPHCYCIAKKDDIYREALKQSDLLYPDGIGIVLAAKILYGQKIPRITGSAVHRHLLEEAQKKCLKVFYLGSDEVTLQKISMKIKIEYPSIRVTAYSPPYKPDFSFCDNQKMSDAINQFKPDILFVGMTAPKQEKWVFQNRHKINAPLICSIGAVFNFYAGTVRRPGKFWISIGLEWLPRLLKEPLRLWKRTIVSAPLFIFYVIQEKIRMLMHRSDEEK
jgi:N-acetylglucosaminyldiphosphoundecaprenol N-acetyl-beta-D-mannosaminyltransferase